MHVADRRRAVTQYDSHRRDCGRRRWPHCPRSERLCEIEKLRNTIMITSIDRWAAHYSISAAVLCGGGGEPPVPLPQTCPRPRRITSLCVFTIITAIRSPLRPRIRSNVKVCSSGCVCAGSPRGAPDNDPIGPHCSDLPANQWRASGQTLDL